MSKIIVKREGREGVYIPDKESLKSYIKNSGMEYIHNIIPNGPMMIGADHALESVLDHIEQADRLAVLTIEASAQNMGHSLAVITGNKLEVYDIGAISEADLTINGHW